MSKLFNGSIDLNKIDKSKIVTVDKNGQPFANGAKYLNITVWLNDAPDQYGNMMSISINQTKEEREAGGKKVYIGNCKPVEPTRDPIPTAGGTVTELIADDGLPF